MSAAQHTADGNYTAAEITVALFVALSVPVWTLVLINLSELATEGRAPAIAGGDEVPIQVTPVLDLEAAMPKLGGGKKKMRLKMPDMWAPPDPVKLAERRAQLSTQAGESVEDIPPENTPLADGGEAIDPDAEVATVSPEEGPDAGDAPEGEGSPIGSPKGKETDPLRGRAAALYAGRISAFLQGGFSCGSAPEEERASCTPSATFSISGDGTVTGFTMAPCGSSATITGAAQSAAAGKVGQQIPPPPENYPDLRPNSFSVSYVCRK